MKKTMIVSMLNVVVVTATIPVRSLDLIDQEAVDAHFTEERQRHQTILEKTQKAKTDDDHTALSEAIKLVFFNLESTGENIKYLQEELVPKFEITQALLIKALECTVRENLSAIAKDEKAVYSSSAAGSLQMLVFCPIQTTRCPLC